MGHPPPRGPVSTSETSRTPSHRPPVTAGAFGAAAVGRSSKRRPTMCRSASRKVREPSPIATLHVSGSRLAEGLAEPSVAVEVSGLEPPTSTLRTYSGHHPYLGHRMRHQVGGDPTSPLLTPDDPFPPMLGSRSGHVLPPGVHPACELDYTGVRGVNRPTVDRSPTTPAWGPKSKSDVKDGGGSY